MDASGHAKKLLIVEVVEARDLLPKDGTGTSSPYARVDFDGQRRKTRTLPRDLNPVWNEVLEFDLRHGEPFDSNSAASAWDPLEVAVFHDLKVGPSRRNNFLGRVRLDPRRYFVKKGEEALIYFPLEKKALLNWVRGDIGLRVYYVDAPLPEPAPVLECVPPMPMPPSTSDDAPKMENEQPIAVDQENGAAPPSAVDDNKAADKPLALDETSPASHGEATEAATDATVVPPEPAPVMQPPGGTEEPRCIPPPRQLPSAVHKAPSTSEIMEPARKYDLVDKMQYLFVRVVRARSLPTGAKPHVRLSTGRSHVSTREARRGAFFEWDQTFAFSQCSEGTSIMLEISVWDLPPDDSNAVEEAEDKCFLGGLCFDVSEIPGRDPPDGPLATQWYRLEGGPGGDLMLATWLGTQADDCFHDAHKADTPPACHLTSRSKIYLSPKMWYLRLTVIEAQDTFTAPLPREAPVFVRAALGFQTLKTRAAEFRNAGPLWNEDLVFVAAEPFVDDECLLLSLEIRNGKDSFAIGSAVVAISTLERRVDDRKVTSRWLDLIPNDEIKKARTKKSGTMVQLQGGRLHVRTCLDGGYHVADEPQHACSDFRPSARQLWRPQIGTVELGVVGCRNLLPMKTVQYKGSTDAYAVAKYGPKWIRTRTVADSLDPQWNEQYTWPVYDPATVLTVAVFDDSMPAMVSPEDGDKYSTAACSRPMGKVRIRISSLESGRIYRGSYPLILMLPSGTKRMGEIELALRFTGASSPLDLLLVYGHPLMPAMHRIRPIPAPLQEPLRLAAARLSAVHLSRSEPPLSQDVSLWMLEATEPPTFSMRKVRANWQRMVAALSWFTNSVRWVNDMRSWRNPTATVIAHLVILLLAWHPELAVPTVAFHLAAVGAWKYRWRPRGPDPHPCLRASQAEVIDRDELDEEFDPMPSSKGPEVVRRRYDRSRAIGMRAQMILGDVATQAERLQALVTWRDPRATALFLAFCVVVGLVLYAMPGRMVAVVAGFYFLRHPLFRDRTSMPLPINFFRRLPSMADRTI